MEAVAVVKPEESLTLQKVGAGLFKSGLFPNAKNEYGAFAIVEYGRELGIGPMMALKNINIISGQVACNAQLMLSLALAKGVTYSVVKEGQDGATIVFKRGEMEYKAIFDKHDAEAAGLLSKDNWKKYPADMYFWRAVAKGIRRVAPDAILGLYTADEISEGQFKDVIDIPVEAQGEPEKQKEEVKEEPKEQVKQLLIDGLSDYCTMKNGEFDTAMADGILKEISMTTKGKFFTWESLNKMDENKYPVWFQNTYTRWNERNKE